MSHDGKNYNGNMIKIKKIHLEKIKLIPQK